MPLSFLVGTTVDIFTVYIYTNICLRVVLSEGAPFLIFFFTKHISTAGSRLSGRVLFKGAYVCMYCIYGWIPFCNRIIENKRN